MHKILRVIKRSNQQSKISKLQRLSNVKCRTHLTSNVNVKFIRCFEHHKLKF